MSKQRCSENHPTDGYVSVRHLNLGCVRIIFPKVKVAIPILLLCVHWTKMLHGHANVPTRIITLPRIKPNVFSDCRRPVDFLVSRCLLCLCSRRHKPQSLQFSWLLASRAVWSFSSWSVTSIPPAYDRPTLPLGDLPRLSRL